MTTQYANASLTLTTSAQTLYTVPSTVESAIVIFGVCNNITSNTTLTLHVVDSGDSVANTNQLISAVTVATSSPNPLDAITGAVLETGDSISALAGANNSLNIRISVLEILSN